MFFNVGGAEVLVIAVIALIAVGPEQLPTVIRKFGRTMGQVRAMAAGLRDEFMAGAADLGDAVDPSSWLNGSGSEDDPVVRRGYADLVNNKSNGADADGKDAGPSSEPAAVADVAAAGSPADGSPARADDPGVDAAVGPVAEDAGVDAGTVAADTVLADAGPDAAAAEPVPPDATVAEASGAAGEEVEAPVAVLEEVVAPGAAVEGPVDEVVEDAPDEAADGVVAGEVPAVATAGADGAVDTGPDGDGDDPEPVGGAAGGEERA